MQSLFKSPIFRALLAFLVVLVVGLAIWYVGPMLSFDKLRPFESISIRVTLIVMLVVLVLLLYFEMSVLLIGVSALCLLIWHAGALLAFGGMRPLEPVWVRALLIGIIVVAFVVYTVYSLLKMFVNDPEMAKKIFSGGKEPAQELAKEEVKNMFGIAKHALAQLKNMRLGAVDGAGKKVSVFQRLLEGKRYLYELPWYMIIGNPATGKTTALLNSGLKFPINHQMGGVSSQTALANNSGTLNCAWWFTNDAVLVDTAGRFTAHGTGDDRGKHAAEWRGFLGVLRKARPRAPINGVVVALDVAELIALSEDGLAAYAAVFRSRLEELRTELGIRFPVYVMVTKTDLLKGFSDYFNSLTAEGRSQVWGFTLPWTDDRISFKFKKSKPANTSNNANGSSTNDDSQSDLTTRLHQELLQLQLRLEDGVNLRMQEEYEVQRRTKLYALPQEFGGLSKKLSTIIESLFADSRFDSTQLKHSLRGVYFTSCHQVDLSIRAETQSLWARLEAGVQKFINVSPNLSRAASTGQRSYFANDVLQKIIFPEAHLVKPNLRWETRFRFLRMFGHAIVGVVFFWLISAVLLSFNNNSSYLGQANEKVKTLSPQLAELLTSHNAALLPDVLTAVQNVPEQTGLDVSNPSAGFTYGLYTGSNIADASGKTYAYVQDNYVLPVVVKRLETVLGNSVAGRDAKTAYDTLRIYLMLHEKERYKAQDVKEWALKDWQDSSNASGTSANTNAKSGAINENKSSATTLSTEKNNNSGNVKNISSQTAKKNPTGNLAVIFDGRATMIGHLESLFSGERVVQSASTRNEALVKAARDFLGANSSSERLYDRTKAGLNGQTPEEFTLVRVVGPQVGTVFNRASGAPLEKGIPGLFTYEGYHEVFAKQLPQMIALAQEDDAWVMGKEGAKKKARDDPASKLATNALIEDVRRQYLTEYAQRWTQLLEDIRPLTGSNLSFDLNVLRQLAAPDSPLGKLAKAAAKETSLTKSIAVKSEEEKSFLDKASDQLDKKSKDLNKNFGLRPESRMERDLVDNRFSALREIVTGQADGPGAAAAGKSGLESITGLINEYYTVLVIADTAITGSSLPPVGVDIAAKLKLESGKLPAPFKETLITIAISGADKVAVGAASVLKVQAQAQLDRLLGLMSALVSEPCKRGIEGRYPFASSNQEVAIEDFNAIFASGGVADDYFTKYLLPLVDTSTKPWRYKNPSTANAMVGIESTGAAPAPASTGPTLQGELLKLLIQSGPNPEHFYKIAQIRDVFFREAGGKRMAWKMDLKIAEMDATITELLIDIDGQTQRYSHGPVQALTVTWPGPRGGVVTEISASPRVRPDTSSVLTKGPWAILRLLERSKVGGTASGSKSVFDFTFDNRKMSLDITTAGGGVSPFTGDLLKGFRCPGRI